MPARRLPFFLFVISLGFSTSVAHASTIRKRPTKAQRVSYYVPVKSSSVVHAVSSQSLVGSPFAGSFGLPSSPDNWRGGTGNWSNGADWTAGLPAGSSDVTINTGTDTVVLDTSSSINSLTLGGATGRSFLTGDGNAHTVTIAGALTVNQSGSMLLLADNMTVGANSSNAGTIDLENGSTLQVNGAFNNSGSVASGSRFGFFNTLNVTGQLTNSGMINLGTINGGCTLTVGGLNNTGNIGMIYSQLVVSGNAMNSGGIGDYGAQGGPGLFLQIAGNFMNTGQIFTTSGDYSFVSVGGTLTNSGPISMEGGTLSAGTLNNQGRIIVYSSPDQNPSSVLAGSATNSGAITLGLEEDGTRGEYFNVTGSLTNSPGGLIQLVSLSESVSAGSLVNNGTINLAGPEATLNVSGGAVNAGTISSTRNAALLAASLANSGSINLNSFSSLQVSGDVTNSGAITTSGDDGNVINITGKLTNSAGGTFSMATNFDTANVGYVTNAGTINLGSGTMLTVTGGSHATATALPGFLNNGVVNIGQGATLLSAASFTQITGQTTVDGTLQVAGHSLINLAGGSLYGNGGTVAGNITSNASINIGDMPMTVGALNFMGDYTQGANGSLTFDIAGNAPGQYDQLNVSGHAQLNGLMTVDLLNGYIPQLGNTFEVMTYGSESGTFSMVLGLPINGQEHFVLEYNSTNLTLDVQSGQISGPTTKGGNGTYFVSEPFISTAGDGSSSSTLAQNNSPGAATPEPGSIVLFASGLAGIGAILRRRSKR